MATTSELIELVLSGERDAFGAIVAEHQDMLLAYAAFRVPQSDLVEEIVQQTFIRAYQQLAEFDRARDFGVWLRAICKYVVLAELKRSLLNQRNLENYRDEIRHRLAGAAIERCEHEAATSTSRLEVCLRRLQERARSLIDFRYNLRLSIDEIAKRLNLSASHVAVTLFRIRGTLRKCMEGATQAAQIDGGTEVAQ